MPAWPDIDDYKAWARIVDTEDDAAITQAVAAAVSAVEERVNVELTEVKDEVFYACLLWTNRLMKRRNSPEGVVGTNPDGIAVDIGRSDPDVRRLLEPYIDIPVA
jgi:hypothetical protein